MHTRPHPVNPWRKSSTTFRAVPEYADIRIVPACVVLGVIY
jgi:hypothetical protein